ncbi:MAG: hydrogenase maturation protease [Gammaproteobacteria bacterium]
MTKSIRIVGVGSVFGADQIAMLVIEQIKAKMQNHSCRENMDIEYYDRPGFHLLELIKGAATVHLIDAIVSDKAEGFIHRYTDINVFKSLNKGFSSHGYGVAEVLQLAQAMAYLPTNLVIHGVEINKEKGLTPVLITACQQLADNVVAEVLSI